MVYFHPIIYRGHKRFICLYPLGYHAARAQEIAKDGGTVVTVVTKGRINPNKK